MKNKKQEEKMKQAASMTLPRIRDAIKTVALAFSISLLLVFALMLATFLFYHGQPHYLAGRQSLSDFGAVRAETQASIDIGAEAFANEDKASGDTLNVLMDLLTTQTSRRLPLPKLPLVQGGFAAAESSGDGGASSYPDDPLLRLALAALQPEDPYRDECDRLREQVRNAAIACGISASTMSVEAVRPSPSHPGTTTRFMAVLNESLTPAALYQAINDATRGKDVALVKQIESAHKLLIQVYYQKALCVEFLCISPTVPVDQEVDSPPLPPETQTEPATDTATPQTEIQTPRLLPPTDAVSIPPPASTPPPPTSPPSTPIPEKPQPAAPTPVSTPEIQVPPEPPSAPIPETPKPATPTVVSTPETQVPPAQTSAPTPETPQPEAPTTNLTRVTPLPPVPLVETVPKTPPPSEAGVKAPVPAQEIAKPKMVPIKTQEGYSPAYLSIILDDGGYGGKEMTRVMELDNRLTLAILPDTPFARQTVDLAKAKGFAIMLHMPMQAGNGNKNHFPGELRIDMNREQIQRRTQECIAQFPEAIGVNNHTGGLFTTYAEKMGWFLETVRAKGLFFVDSRTVGSTCAYKKAIEMHVPTVQRDLFLDHSNNLSDVRKRFSELAGMAKKHGWAVGIGHFRPNTVTVLSEKLPGLKDEGIILVPVSEMAW